MALAQRAQEGRAALLSIALSHNEQKQCSGELVKHKNIGYFTNWRRLRSSNSSSTAHLVPKLWLLLLLLLW